MSQTNLHFCMYFHQLQTYAMGFYRLPIKVAECRQFSCIFRAVWNCTTLERWPESEMRVLSYFAIQIQSWIFKTRFRSNHSPKSLINSKSKSKKLKKTAFWWQKLCNSFPLTQSKSGPDLKFLEHFNFAVWFQSKINKIRNQRCSDSSFFRVRCQSWSKRQEFWSESSLQYITEKFRG